eukprot:gnl/TRDRNA2_/TRDRNA2_133987_c0_seq1.p1 gnl/TRDRNA2_/TRDRNA2_133987_c0~~gnl/TRDRNA2_/TRDRNA2_133987_c0_seq1.p1  ORF type:complete len:461 (-),score=56.39 gnl/TRDRNA2_/TRDRNA2_133987_c0_seq1:67-1449(-)
MRRTSRRVRSASPVQCRVGVEAMHASVWESVGENTWAVISRLGCRKRRAPSISRNLEPSSAFAAARVVVVCRGVPFETSKATLLRFGPCYLATQADIDTEEEIHLDYSADAFRVLLDALTVAQHDLSKALLYVSRKRSSVVDLEALLHFVLLDWIVGVSLPLPPLSMAGTPKGDSLIPRMGFKLRDAYQGKHAGVFHYLLDRMPRAELPCGYEDEYQMPQILLGNGEEYVEPLESTPRGCIAVSVEQDPLLQKSRSTWTEEFEEWGDAVRRTSSIHMLRVTSLSRGDYFSGDTIMMYAGGSAVFDLGKRHLLICEGLVLGMSYTDRGRKRQQKDCHDMLAVDVVSDLESDIGTSRLACQPLQLEGDRVTYSRLTFPEKVRRLGRIFRLSIDPFCPDIGDHCTCDDLSGPLYMLHSLELFGELLELPAGFTPGERLRAPFTIEPRVTRVKRRRFVGSSGEI